MKHLRRLADRALGRAPSVAPRIAARFEPASGLSAVGIVERESVAPHERVSPERAAPRLDGDPMPRAGAPRFEAQERVANTAEAPATTPLMKYDLPALEGAPGRHAIEPSPSPFPSVRPPITPLAISPIPDVRSVLTPRRSLHEGEIRDGETARSASALAVGRDLSATARFGSLSRDPRSLDRESGAPRDRAAHKEGPRLEHQESSPLGAGRAPHAVRAASQEHEQAPPSIRVEIGRIELRVPQAPAAAPPRARARPRPALSLSDYLARRKAGAP